LPYQAATLRLKDWLVPSAWFAVTIPVAVPFWLDARKPRSVPAPDSSTVWPAVTSLSSVPDATHGGAEKL
jgi:hypothetical protein